MRVEYLNSKISAFKGLLVPIKLLTNVDDLISYLRSSVFGKYIDKYSSSYQGVELVSIALSKFFSYVMITLRKSIPKDFVNQYELFSKNYVFNSLGVVLFARETGRRWTDIEPYLVYTQKGDLSFYRRVLDSEDVYNELKKSKLGREVLSLSLSGLNDYERSMLINAREHRDRQIILMFKIYMRKFYPTLILNVGPSLRSVLKESIDVKNVVILLRALERNLSFEEVEPLLYKGGFFSFSRLKQHYPDKVKEIAKRYNIKSEESYKAEIEGNNYLHVKYRKVLSRLYLKPERAVAFLLYLDSYKRKMEAVAKASWFEIGEDELSEVIG